MAALQDADKFEALINNSGMTDTTGRERMLLLIDEEYNSFSPDLYLYFWRRLYFDLIDENKKVEVCKFTDEYVERVEENGEEAVMHLLETCKTEDFDYIYKVNYTNETEKKGEFFKVKNRTGNAYSLEFIGESSF